MDRLSAEQLLPIGYVPNNWASGRASQLLIPQKLADEMRDSRMNTRRRMLNSICWHWSVCPTPS